MFDNVFILNDWMSRFAMDYPALPVDAKRFPLGFVFGSATSSHQIEGSWEADGRGASWWDRFALEPGRIADGSTAAVACDHYRRWEADVALLAALRQAAYRFSIAWSRVLPSGTGPVNPAGLDFYERLVDGLLARGIKPMATLYHWDLPQALAERGAWQNRDTAERFAEFAQAVVQRLGDRVWRWSTLNEPRCSAYVGHLEGRHAPGLKDLGCTLRAAHHLLLAHARALACLRSHDPRLSVGIVLDLKPFQAASSSPQDQQAAWRGDGIFNRWFLDALFKGAYPQDIAQAYEPFMPAIEAGDLRDIAAPIDHLGINYYTRSVVEEAPGQAYPHLCELRQAHAHHSTMGWEDCPAGLLETLRRVHRDYAPKALYLAENGCAEPDVVAPDGRVHDAARLRYLAGHLDACAQAIAEGIPLDAYLHWSFLDNFEWGRGYTQRFGLVHMNYATQQRTPKNSALAYRDFIARHAG